MARKKRTITDAAGRAMPLTRRGFGAVRQLSSGNWQASYVGPDSQRHKAPSTFLTRAAAETWLADIHHAIKDDLWRPERADQDFGMFSQNWLATRRRSDGRELSPKTKMNYTSWLKQLAALDDTALRQITPAQCRKIHAKATCQSGATSAARQMRIARTILNTALKDDLITKNPVPPELCRSSSGQKNRPPTQTELAKILDTIEPRLRLAVCFAAFGGLRLGEWRALRRKDLTKQDGYWTINVTRQAVLVDGGWQVTPPKSEQGNRQVALPQWLNREIETHLKNEVGTAPGSLIFPPTRTGQFIDTEWRKAWTTARLAAGIKNEVRGHDLRHYYATSLAEAGASAPLLQAALGHATIDMSMKYVHAAKGASPALADLLRPVGN
jgi:integrase